MTTATSAVASDTQSSWVTKWKQSPILSIVVPYGVCIAVQLPLLVLYYFTLWKFRPHYQWFPFAILATVAGIYLRWPTQESNPFRASALSNLFFVLGILFGIAGALFVELWFPAASIFSFVLSFCARTKDAETGKSMLPVALPLVLTLYWPASLDIKLITSLQSFSSTAASNVLDLLGYMHYLDGTILQFPERSYGVEEACSGVMSFFTLLFITTVFVVWTHRPWFRSLILIVTALFWALLMNSLRILLIPIAQISFGIDLSSGLPHELLGYFVLILAILLMLSTDQFLTFLFGPVDPQTFESSNVLIRRVSALWNEFIAGSAEPRPTQRTKSRAIGRGGLAMIFGGAVLMLLVGMLSAEATIRSLRSGIAVRFFDNYRVVRMEHNDLPTSLGTWNARSDGSGAGFYSFQDRVRGSDLGVRSDSWVYYPVNLAYRAFVSLDQPFPGWHELTRCYQNSGWNLVPNSRLRKSEHADTPDPTAEEGSPDWPYVQVEFTNQFGEHGFLLFCFFDAFGEPFEAPGSWNVFQSYLERIKNRLNNRVRARLFKSESYQVQVFVSTTQELSEEEKDEVRANFLLAREQLRLAFLKRRQQPDSTNDLADKPESGTEAERP